MTDNSVNDTRVSRSVEKHITAAWAGIEQMKPGSNVTIPPLEGVVDAKEYVDSNQK